VSECVCVCGCGGHCPHQSLLNLIQGGGQLCFLELGRHQPEDAGGVRTNEKSAARPTRAQAAALPKHIHEHAHNVIGARAASRAGNDSRLAPFPTHARPKHSTALHHALGVNGRGAFVVEAAHIQQPLQVLVQATLLLATGKGEGRRPRGGSGDAPTARRGGPGGQDRDRRQASTRRGGMRLWVGGGWG
jgi:hypothetical protein